MRAIRKFEDFVQEGIVRKQFADISRAKFLIEDAKKSHIFLHKKIEVFGVDDQTANDIVKSCYDVVMQIIRYNMLLQGYNAQGQRAHEAEVSYLRVLGCKEKHVQFADQLRYFRNGMLYYGTATDAHYATQVIAFTDYLYEQLQ